METTRKNWGLMAILALSVACGQIVESGEGASLGLAESNVLGSVTQIDFDSNNNAVVNFNDVAPDDRFIVSLYSHDNAGQTYAYELTTSSGLSSSAALVKGASLRDAGSEEGEGVENSTEDFHDTLRRLEGEVEDDDPLETRSGGTPLRAVTANLSVGSKRTFNVLSDFSGDETTTVTAELRYATSHFTVYVDVRNEDALDDADIETLFAPFDELVEEEYALFGEISDVNDDNHFTVLLTQAVNELGSSSGGIITGFFYALDLYPASSHSASNEMEIIYSMVPDPSGSFGTAVSKSFALSNFLPSVLPHELQHAINYNNHVLMNGGSSESSFLNEALSHLAEDIYSIDADGYMAQTGIDNPSRVALYLAGNSTVCFACGSSLTQRGGSYLFVRYLYEQAEKGNLAGAANGEKLVARLLDTNLTGIANLTHAALETIDTSRFDELMGIYATALNLSDTGLASDNRYQFSGINLRADQNDNRGTVLQGPLVEEPEDLPFADTVTSSGVANVVLTGDRIIEGGNQINIALSSDMNGGGVVIQINAE
ncbi:MAG: hypothetical protein HY541_04495 [Deltaproteobacteria bacterium]|nr:hypothetical protein [Deltaproteobacteria bacterium]